MTDNKNFNFKSKVFDLHVHTMVNDKNSYVTESQLNAINEVYKKPFIVVDNSINNKWYNPSNFIGFGREVSVSIDAFKGHYREQGLADFIILGWIGNYPKIDTDTGIFNGNIDEFLNIYTSKNTAIILVHPTRNFRFLDNVDLLPSDIKYVAKNVDAIEVFNSRDDEYHHLMNYSLATKLSKCMVAGSDAIYANKIYSEFTEFKNHVGDMPSIVESIKNKEARPFVSEIKAQSIASYMGIDLETKKPRKAGLNNRKLNS